MIKVILCRENFSSVCNCQVKAAGICYVCMGTFVYMHIRLHGYLYIFGFEMAHSRSPFLYFVFSIQLTVNKC